MDSIKFRKREESCNIWKSKDIRFSEVSHPTLFTNSVLGIKFDGGVALAADCAASSGHITNLTDVKRMHKINDWIAMAADGCYGDYQFISDILENRSKNDEVLADGFHSTGKSLHFWLTRYMYAKRSQLDPLWNTLVIAGYENGESFLGTVDKLGLGYEENCVATGTGSYVALPLMRSAMENNKAIEQKEAIDILMKGMEVLFYRDKNAIQQVEFAIVEDSGVNIYICDEISCNWKAAKNIRYFMREGKLVLISPHPSFPSKSQIALYLLLPKDPVCWSTNEELPRLVFNAGKK